MSNNTSTKHCDVCDKDVRSDGFAKHEATAKHTANMEAAKADVVDEGKRITKGQLIAEFYAENPDATRAEVAEAIGCTVGRVGEIIRAGLTNGTGMKPAETKGDLVLKEMLSREAFTRNEIAEAVGCVVGRVGEVFRANADLFEETGKGVYAPKQLVAS